VPAAEHEFAPQLGVFTGQGKAETEHEPQMVHVLPLPTEQGWVPVLSFDPNVQDIFAGQFVVFNVGLVQAIVQGREQCVIAVEPAGLVEPVGHAVQVVPFR
jgi:hypothetical protein